MSEFAFIRFLSNGLLTEEERKDKNEIIQLTEDVLHARGMECDASIARLSADQLKDILEQVRVLRKKKAKEQEEKSTRAKCAKLYQIRYCLKVVEAL